MTSELIYKVRTFKTVVRHIGITDTQTGTKTQEKKEQVTENKGLVTKLVICVILLLLSIEKIDEGGRLQVYHLIQMFGKWEITR